MSKLDVRDLTISFQTNNGSVKAVRGISFQLNPGETLAVAGESGSGKSVTARAIMGILAGNAVVEGGEIIYDGRDLLKLPEEEFHTLRGHRLAMVFQDPLSALNPIMKIGRQLTEAMLLNDKERRTDGRRRYDQMLRQLGADLTAATGDEARVKSDLARFRQLTEAGVRIEAAQSARREEALSALDQLESLDLALLKGDRRALSEAGGTLDRLLKNLSIENPVAAPLKGYRDEQAPALREAMAALKGQLTPLSAQAPSDPFAGDQDFLDGFTERVAQALSHAQGRANAARGQAVVALKGILPTFEPEVLDPRACLKAARQAGSAVRACIDPLDMDKDSDIYVFESSLTAAIERWDYGRRNNPKEARRYAREEKAHQRLTARGRFAPDPVPLDQVDLPALHQRMLDTIHHMLSHLSAPADKGLTDRERANGIVQYLRDRAREFSHHLTPAMARHRAIELMKEVGIPQPQRRFDQYPFEFSGGMRQRIVIAIALSANPDILICDEPTTALDVTIQAQILELINRLKRQRGLSVIFITHDLGVVANMADRVAVMYAGKIVEYGTSEDIFYDPRHPYTWALLSAMPDLETEGSLDAIPGTPPNMILPPKGDAFAPRNRYAMEIDLEEQPPMFKISDTHAAATWLLHPDAPQVPLPDAVRERIERMKARREAGRQQAVGSRQ